LPFGQNIYKNTATTKKKSNKKPLLEPGIETGTSRTQADALPLRLRIY